MNRWKTENLAQALKPASSDQEMDLDNPVTPNPTGQTFSASRPSLAHRESQVQGVRSSLYTRSPICVRSPILSPCLQIPPCCVTLPGWLRCSTRKLIKSSPQHRLAP
ncbi:hypothetical protein PCANC_27549 [Puccinia coronata f. sp. avenae]|uniref:Uncharacterized protein n=1 Tax=Puccinia coronata f. sp. avenae TaxID=200324 RepID=A0A2N5RWV0_9BASI|nr:hypothetical protein PCANC_27549 [Puccinia coronata f. sp. avenae]